MRLDVGQYSTTQSIASGAENYGAVREVSVLPRAAFMHVNLLFASLTQLILATAAYNGRHLTS